MRFLCQFLLVISLVVVGSESVRAQGYAPGQQVVTKSATKIMEGQASLGTAPAGSVFAIEKVSEGGGWLLGSFTLNGRKVSGWVNAADVLKPASPVRPATPTPAAAPPPPATGEASGAMDFRKLEENYNRMIYRYDRKFEFPATLYGFLPVRQGLVETITPDLVARNRYAVSDYLYARFPLDPSTAREPATTQLLESLGAPASLDAVLNQLSQLAEQPVADSPAERPRSAAQERLLDLLARDLYTDAVAQAQSNYQRAYTQSGASHPDTMSEFGWVLFLRRIQSGLEVETLHHQGLAWATQQYGAGHAATSRAWNNLALVRHDRGDSEAARILLLHALNLRSREAAAATADMPLLLMNLDRILVSEGRMAEALRCAQVSRALVRALPEPVRQKIAFTCLDEFIDSRIVETGGAPFYMRSGLAYRPSMVNFAAFGGAAGRRDGNETESSGFDSLNMSQLMNSQATGAYPHTGYMLAAAHYSRQRDMASAERFSRKAIELAKRSFQARPDMHWHITMNQHALALTLQLTGNFEGAAEVLREAIQLQYPLWDKEWRAGQAAFASGQGEYYAWSAYQIYGELLLVYAKVHADMGRWDDAERLYREALKVVEMPTRIDKRSMTLNLSHGPQCRVELAQVLLKRGQTAEAEELLRSVLHEDFRRWCFSIGCRLRAAPALTELAILQAARDVPTGPVTAAQMLHDAYSLSSLGTAEKTAGYAHPQLIEHARTMRRHGKLAEAALLLNRSIRQVEEFRRDVGGDELNRARYFSELTRTAPHAILAQLHIEAGDTFTDHFGVGEFGPKAAFDALELGRGRALLDLMNRGGGDVASAAMTAARRRNDDTLIQRVTQLQAQEAAARGRVAQIIERATSSAAPADATRLQAELDAARNQERQASRDLFDVARGLLEQDAIQPMTWKRTSDALRPGEALVAYDVGATESVIVVVWPEGRVEGTSLKWPDGKPVTGDSLQEAVREFFYEISREDTPEDVAEAAYGPEELRAAVLPNELWQRLKVCSRLYLVADGPLHQVPFESLFLEDSGAAIVIDEAPPLVYGPSATVLLHPRVRASRPLPANRLELLALGDPQFSREGAAPAGSPSAASVAVPMAERTRALTRFGTLAPLPGTRAELQVIRQTLEQSRAGADLRVKTLAGADATVTNLFEATAQPRFLHIATHGLAEGGRKAFDSALAMAAPPQVTASDVGFLRLSDLLTQWGGKLDGTDLVVLSACRTARGEMEAGDGFVALTWGFLFAGSRSVVASLWEVDDNATALLMARLYENLLGSFPEPRHVAGQNFAAGTPIPPAVALLEAKRWLRGLSRTDAETQVQRLLGPSATVPSGDRPYSDPFYWGAFVLIGEDRAAP